MKGNHHSIPPEPRPMARSVVRDSEVLLALNSRSPEAFASLYATYSPRLFRTIIAITRNHADAEDVLQETCLRVYLALDTFEGRSSFYSWLTQIAINSALMFLRKRRNRAEVTVGEPSDNSAETSYFEFKDPAPSPEQVYQSRQSGAKLEMAIRKLSPRLREPLEMQLAEDSSMKEISRSLGISVASVKARLHRARARLCASQVLNGTGRETALQRRAYR